MKKIVLTLIIIQTLFLGLIYFKQIPNNLGGGILTSAFKIKNASSTAYTIGPGNSIRVIATSTNRSWLRFESVKTGSSCTVFLNLEDDKAAIINDMITVTASSSYQQIGFPIYTGSVNAITDCAASSTLLISEGNY